MPVSLENVESKVGRRRSALTTAETYLQWIEEVHECCAGVKIVLVGQCHISQV